MIGVIEGLGLFGSLIDVGAIGAVLILVWRLMVHKDKKSYEIMEQINTERQEIFESQKELIREVVQALADKNSTDALMSASLERLVEELRKTREKRHEAGS